VDYRTYPNNIGHKYFIGCFRCHDGKHIGDNKKTVSRECNVCHEFQRPVSVPGLQNAFLQGTIEHLMKLEGPHADLQCSSCHTGGRGPDPTCKGCHTAQTSFSRGDVPALPGLKATKSIMAEVECDACHDLGKPLTAENMTAQCDACHKKGYGDKLAVWKDEAASSRAKALAALDELRKNAAASQSLQALLREMQGAFDVVEKAGAMHNPEFASAVYDRIVKAAADSRPTATGKK
ncbi:MAG: cytochrome c3 family protein, partial [Kiritimatiellota bacterium]|nr:cytochrome c3 family protein [Kiritimatiellota bacterium]